MGNSKHVHFYVNLKILCDNVFLEHIIHFSKGKSSFETKI